jgi:hypothetical protein
LIPTIKTDATIDSIFKKEKLNINLKISRAILLSSGESAECVDIVNQKGFKAAEIITNFKNLENMKLGTFKKIKSVHGPSNKLFSKTVTTRFRRRRSDNNCS